MNRRIYEIIFMLVITSQVYSQWEKDSLLVIWNDNEVTAKNRAVACHDLIRDYYLLSRLDSAYIMVNKLLDFTNHHNLDSDKANALLLAGLIDSSSNNNELALNNYLNALNMFKSQSDVLGEIGVLNNIGLLFNKDFRFHEALKYLKRSLELSQLIKDSHSEITCLSNIGFVYNNIFKTDSSLIYLNKALDLAKITNSPKEFIIEEIGNNYVKRKDYKTALAYYNEALKLSRENHNIKRETSTLFRISTHYIFQNDYINAIKYGKESLEKARYLGDVKFINASLLNLYEASKETGDFYNSLYYLEESFSEAKELKEVTSNRQLQEFEIQQLRLKDSLINESNKFKENLRYQKEKTNLTLAWGGSLSAVSIFAFLIFRNTKRKQRKAERERQQQIEEKEKILKDLELSTIDAMIQGQEKERQRLAEDLHDSVGVTLTAAKMQFEYLIKHQTDTKASEELIKKTSTLLENAYVEVRSMAHLKNSGVMAKDGLLPAVEKLSANASGLNGLHFDVNSHGLDQRLENAVEIAVFRIIQELTTNVIKHANATQATIHLINHDDSLNIMVEDNGKGFNPSQINKTNSGMGISSIDKRVAHLGGTMTIESENNKGTTVIIDLPL